MASTGERAREVVVQREPILSVLVGSKLDKRELVDRLDVSRSTVDRGIRDLETYGFVGRENGGFTATSVGEAAYRAYCQFEEQLDEFDRMRTILEHVDPEDGLDPAILVGAEAYLEYADPPESIAFQVSKHAADAEHIESVTRTLSRERSALRLHAAVVERNTSFSGVYAVDIASFLKAWDVEDRHEMAETGRYRAFVTDEETPFTVFLYHHPDHIDVCIFIYDENDEIFGLIVNDTEAAVEWARAYYQRFRESAIEITNQF